MTLADPQTLGSTQFKLDNGPITIAKPKNEEGVVTWANQCSAHQEDEMGAHEFVNMVQKTKHPAINLLYYPSL